MPSRAFFRQDPFAPPMRRAEPKLTRPGAADAEGRRRIIWLSPKRPGLGGRAILAAVLAHLLFTVFVFLELDPRAPRHGALEVEEQGFDIVFQGSLEPGAPVAVPPSPPPPAPPTAAVPSTPPVPPQIPAPTPPPVPELPRPPQPTAQQTPPSPTPPQPPRPLAEAPAPPPPPPPPPQLAEAA
ncbi:MAG: hypothetical protein ACKPB8_15700, partial [Alphaproteobacteria bacterium]